MCTCIEPNNERAATNKDLYRKMMEDKQQQQQLEQQDEAGDGVTEFVNRKNKKPSQDFDTYERLCRGEQTHVCTRIVY